MSNVVKDISMKSHIYYFFDDIINIKEFDPNNIKLDENSYKNILIYYIGYVTIKDSKYVKINSVNPLYLMFNKMNGYFEEINGNKYLTVVAANDSKDRIKNYEELWIKITDLIMLVTKKADDYDEKFIKIKLDSDDILSLNKMIKISVMVIVVRAIFLLK